MVLKSFLGYCPLSRALFIMSSACVCVCAALFPGLCNICSMKYLCSLSAAFILQPMNMEPGNMLIFNLFIWVCVFGNKNKGVVLGSVPEAIVQAILGC